MEGAAVISSLLVKGTLTEGRHLKCLPHLLGSKFKLLYLVWQMRTNPSKLVNWFTIKATPSFPAPTPTPHPPLPDISRSLSTVESLGFNLPFRQSLLNKWFSFFVYRPLRSHININYSTFLSSLIKYGKCQQRFGKWQEISLVLKMFVLQEND